MHFRLARALAVAALAAASSDCASLSTPSDPTYRSLRRLVENEHIGTLSTLLARLPPSYVSHHTLLFQSRSPQGAEFRNPRVVVYGADASLVIAFNGSPEQPGFQSLDTMELDRTTGGFVFRELVFPDPASHSPPRFSEDNPASCSVCHGTPSRPIWDAYPLWPGAYGERAGSPLSEAERRGLAAYEDARRTSPRYAFLTEHAILVGDAKALAYEGRRIATPNVEFGNLLAHWSAEAIVRDVLGSPRIRDYRYALLASLLGECRDIEMLPPAIEASFGEPYPAYASHVRTALDRQEEIKTFRALPARGLSLADAPPRDNPLLLSRFRYLTERALALRSEPWSTAFERGAYDRSPRAFGSLFIERAAEQNPELRRLVEEARHGDCRELQSRSLARLGAVSEAWPPPHALTEGAHDRTIHELVSTCVGCHEKGTGPAIPFADRDALREAARRGHYTRGSLLSEIAYRLRPEAGARRMPLGNDLSESEVATLEAYFRSALRDDGPLAGDSGERTRDRNQ